MDRDKSGFQPLAFTLTVLAALVRLIPHPPNFNPVGSVALFGGAKLRSWQAYAVPIAAMLVTDPIRSLMEGSTHPYSSSTPVVYACFLINVLLGRWFLRKSAAPLRLALVAIAGSIQFFIFTNLIVWWHGTLYAHTWPGLVECYAAALPFAARTIVGDLFYSGVLFGTYAWLKNRTAAEHEQLA